MSPEKRYLLLTFGEKDRGEIELMADKANGEIDRFRDYYRERFGFPPRLYKGSEIPETSKAKAIVFETSNKS